MNEDKQEDRMTPSPNSPRLAWNTPEFAEAVMEFARVGKLLQGPARHLMEQVFTTFEGEKPAPQVSYVNVGADAPPVRVEILSKGKVSFRYASEGEAAESRVADLEIKLKKALSIIEEAI